MRMTTQTKSKERRWDSASINSIDERMLEDEDDSLIGEYASTKSLLEVSGPYVRLFCSPIGDNRN